VFLAGGSRPDEGDQSKKITAAVDSYQSDFDTIKVDIYAVLWRTIGVLAMTFTTSWGQAIKRSTTGLRVRFFTVKIMTGHGCGGRSTANSFNPCRTRSRRYTDLGRTEM
jgi:hypothetical protein